MENQLQLKNKNTAVLVKQQGRIFSLNDLESEFKNFNSADNSIIKARKTGKALCDLNEDEFNAALTGIIFNISVICGCELPTHEAHINALEKEFSIFLMEFGYDDLTPEEILTAFRMNANFLLPEKIETFGKIFNVDFAAKVLTQYTGKRHSIDVRLGYRVIEIENDKIFEELSDKRRAKVKNQFALFLDGKIAEMDLADCYMQLAEDGAFANQNSLVELWNTEGDRGEKSMKDILKSYDFDLDRMFGVQKAIVMYLFEQMKRTGRLEVYDADLKLLHKGFEVPTVPRQEDLVDRQPDDF